MRTLLRPLVLLGALCLTPACSASSKAPALTLGKSDMGTSAVAKLGEVIEVRLSSPRGVAPEYRVEWSSQAQVTGEALRFVSHERRDPGKQVDGGSSGNIYRFEAIAAGQATISIETTEAGESAPQGPWTASIDVSP